VPSVGKKVNWTLFEPSGALSVASMIGEGCHVEPAATVPPSRIPRIPRAFRKTAFTRSRDVLAPVFDAKKRIVGRVRLTQNGGRPVYVAALAAQFALDIASVAARQRLAGRFSPGSQLRFMGTVYLVDAGLAPIALVLVATGRSWAPLLAVPLVGLLSVFARERQVRIDHALELGHAYRGTALLLGDVVEADDAYTGSHSRDVVDLVLGVAGELGLSPAERRQAEFAALLHDVGKVRIPSEIVNKPGPLTAEERAVIETHTIEGEEMLEKVGGLLGEVGRIVRSCHERVDGAGYPDGLAGDEIPLIARIVCCCDAYSAMTTDRPYRKARSAEAALEELRSCAGTHFDPVVVEALARVI
jgi:putative nucleotidyltransferase with HDIG domain